MSTVNGVTGFDQINTYHTKQINSSTGVSGANFSSFLGETKDMNDIFERAAKKYNVPVNLLKAIGKAESNFNEKAVSRSGAQGVMQLMPATAKYLGVTDSFDAEQNIMGGAKYIKELLNKYDGDTTLALAAYNAGMGNVAKYGGVPPFKETQNYVVKVANFMQEGEATAKKVSPSTAPSFVATPISSTSIEAEDSAVIDPDNIFSYQLYMKFIEKLLEYEKQRDEDKTASKKVNYNVPLMNITHINIPRQ